MLYTYNEIKNKYKSTYQIRKALKNKEFFKIEKENITYYESQIRALLEKIPSELDTEYMSEVRNSYFGNTDSKASVPRYIPNN